MAQRDILNGFTGFANRDSGFVSAGDAIRRAEDVLPGAGAAGSRGVSGSYGASASRAVAASGMGNAGGASAAAGAGNADGLRGLGSLGAFSDGRASGSFAERSFGESGRTGHSADPVGGFGRYAASSQAPRGVFHAERPGSQDIFRYACEKQPDDDLVPHFDPEKLAAIPEQDRRWSWLEVDLNAIRHNTAALRGGLARSTRLLAVVKADAYGHGAVKSAKTMLNSGADYLGVASVDEAIQLREAYVNAPILVLCEPPMESIPLLLGYKIMPSVYTPEFAVRYAEAADAFGLRAPFHLKVNTGMNRIGVNHAEVVPFLRQIGFHRALELAGTYTHFATADEPETLDFYVQLRRFTDCITEMRAAGVNPGIVHAANSSATLRYPEAHFDMVRAGLVLYGYHPCPEVRGRISLRPAMSVHARVTDTHVLPMREGVSYGMRYRSPGSVKTCTVPVGYADGLRRSLSGRVDFLVDGVRFRQVGAICMDQCMFEVDLRTYATRRRVDPQMGDEVVIVGRQGDAEVRLEELCEAADAIPYELLVGFSHRMPKIYK